MSTRLDRILASDFVSEMFFVIEFYGVFYEVKREIKVKRFYQLYILRLSLLKI